jgi:tRNA (pseudouridine54-N1)-methyltransferase
MRDFVCLAHDLPLDGPDSLDDLPGAGRLDLCCRVVTSGLLTSHGVREDAAVHLVVQDEFTVRFDGRSVRHLRPDERSTAARLRDALDAKDGAIGHQEAEPSPGVHVGRFGLAATLARLDGPLLHCHEAGMPLAEEPVPADPTFVLSDHRDFTDAEAALLAERADARVSVGPERLHADQTVTVAHNWLDTDGYRSY